MKRIGKIEEKIKTTGEWWAHFLLYIPYSWLLHMSK
jgi:hypothetical protein